MVQQPHHLWAQIARHVLLSHTHTHTRVSSRMNMERHAAMQHRCTHRANGAQRRKRQAHDVGVVGAQQVAARMIVVSPACAPCSTQRTHFFMELVTSMSTSCLSSSSSIRPCARRTGLAGCVARKHAAASACAHQVPNALLRELGTRNQLHALHLPKVAGVAQHVDEEQLGHIAVAVRVVLLLERRANERALLGHHRPLLRRRLRGSHRTNQVAELAGHAARRGSEAKMHAGVHTISAAAG